MHSSYIEDLISGENEKSVVILLQKMEENLTKVDNTAKTMSGKVKKFQSSYGQNPLCDTRRVSSLEQKINILSKKVDQFVTQNLRISKNLSGKLLQMNQRIEVLELLI